MDRPYSYDCQTLSWLLSSVASGWQHGYLMLIRIPEHQGGCSVTTNEVRIITKTTRFLQREVFYNLLLKGGVQSSSVGFSFAWALAGHQPPPRQTFVIRSVLTRSTFTYLHLKGLRRTAQNEESMEDKQ